MHTYTSKYHMGKQEDIRYFCSLCATHVRLGSSLDLNVTHSYACPNRWPFSDWPGLWLEGSHGGVGKLDWRWGASEQGWEEGEAVLLMAKGDMVLWSQSHPHWDLQPSPEPGSFSCGALSCWEEVLGMVPAWPIWESWSLICLGELELGNTLAGGMRWAAGRWLVLGVHHAPGIAILSSKPWVFAPCCCWPSQIPRP